MKQIFSFLILLTPFAFGAPIGNPASPSILQDGLCISDTFWCQPRVTFLGDFTSQRLFICTKGPASVQKIFSSAAAQLGMVTWSIRERFDCSLVLGSGQNRFCLYQGNHRVEFKPSGGLIWYGEAKLIILEILDTVLGGFAEAGGWDWMKGPLYENERPLNRRSHLQMRFWEFGMALTQRIGFFFPYGGAAVAKSRWKVTSFFFPEPYRLEQKYTIGPFIGCSLSPTSKISLNAEWRGWIENAWTISCEARF